MAQDRRSFLKTAGLAGAAAGLSGVAPRAVAQVQAPAAAEARRAAPQELPKRMTFATLRVNNSFSLGLLSDRGILDVARAEAEFNEGAPTTITELLDGDGEIAGLGRLLDKARASASADRLFVRASEAKFGPCVTDPEKIICIGLNYRRHAAEVGQPVPSVPILFNKYNTALNSHGGHLRVEGKGAGVRL